ncbi:MAG: dihydroxyacetone kinase subunit DhaL [Actinobacteria bacterium]|nr:dihydroxyacetone kinase subunit DhaL [Actinomycetota bacterium]
MSETVTEEGVAAWLRAFAVAVAQNREYLTELDAAIGDADHGFNMDRGMQAVVGRLDGPSAGGGGVGALLKLVGMTLVSTVGGAAGPLYGTFFLQMGKDAGGEPELGVAQWAAALESGVRGVQMRGKAELEDKTMVDTLAPAAQALSAAAASGLSLVDALQRAAEAAEQGMKATIPLVARKGRASYLGERSVGHQDPGATSSWLLMQAAADALASAASPSDPGA